MTLSLIAIVLALSGWAFAGYTVLRLQRIEQRLSYPVRDGHPIIELETGYA